MSSWSCAALLLVRTALGPNLAAPPPDVVPNDNRQPAGMLRDGVLTLDLRADTGLWRPEGRTGRAIPIEAFGEGPRPLTAPAPLIRVPEGTLISASVRNELDHELRVYGLCQRGGAACAPLDVPAGETRRLEFRTGPAGTYHYWATTTGMPLAFRASADTQLSGALVVDPPGTVEADRVFVITEWTSLTREQLEQVAAADDPGAFFLKLRPDALFLINGQSWPNTERLTYAMGDRVRWRVLNLSTQIHPLHLHGFYFDVDAVGDGLRDQTAGPGEKPSVVTQLMQPGSTLTMSWTPERPGNWLFHCHVMTHVSPSLYVDGSPRHADAHLHHGSAGMTGMVLGITVRGSGTSAGASSGNVAPRRMTLRLRREPRRFGSEPAFGFQLVSKKTTSSASDHVPIPGPLLVLKAGEPVEITLINELPEATAIHWHGMELESYYDGVHGFGGTGLRVTPFIAPGQSFVVRFTPPRRGTFMYHTHVHDRRQLTSGLYGAMLVIGSDETFDAATDHVLVLGRDGPQNESPVVVNGMRAPLLIWRAATRHRIRLINITPDDIVAVSLQSNGKPVSWRPLTKDGAAVPAASADARPAQQIIGVGETYDFEYAAAAGRQSLWLEVRSPGGKWHAQGRVILK